MNTTLLEKVKEAGQDYEWYPTSTKMLELISLDIKKELENDYGRDINYSILDIGAGNGNALNTICSLTKNEGSKFAIEKSKVLIDSMPEDIFIIGTDFHHQTLIDKKVDVVFCNPPYSEYASWIRKIVTEANCRFIYLVVPQRWKDDTTTVQMINRRCGLQDDMELKSRFPRNFGSCEVLDSMSFEDSDFRKARAVVDIVKIKLKDNGYRKEINLDVDPFDLWFDTNFSINADKEKAYGYDQTKSKSESLHDLVKGQNIIERLEELYHKDFEYLLNTYKALEKLDYSLFKELGVDIKQVKGGLRSKIEGLKNLYWNELFSNLDAITKRLTSKSRKRLLEKLTSQTAIDFTADNAYAVVVWAIKNANKYFDTQLTEVYFQVADKENIRNYKSNTKLVEDGWRYQKKEQSHFTLDYRLVLDHWNCFSDRDYVNPPRGLNSSVHELLNDICTIGKNFGMDIITTSMDMDWEPRTKNEFFLADGSLFMDVRAYLKGSIHIRLDQGFMKRFNIEAGRLNGWVKSPSEAKEEMGIEEANELFGTNFKLKSIKLLE